MSEASFASLGPRLLARKGGAKPAMRPQLAPLPETVAAEQLEDLGWNDMGTDRPSTAEIVPLTPHVGAALDEDIANAANVVVRRQQKRLAERVLADATLSGSEDSPLARRTPKHASQSATKASKRAAFTLRLDTDRHLKLRLAATMQGISAQALVTEALDALLEQIDDLDALAERLKRN